MCLKLPSVNLLMEQPFFWPPAPYLSWKLIVGRQMKQVHQYLDHPLSFGDLRGRVSRVAIKSLVTSASYPTIN